MSQTTAAGATKCKQMKENGETLQHAQPAKSRLQTSFFPDSETSISPPSSSIGYRT